MSLSQINTKVISIRVPTELYLKLMQESLNMQVSLQDVIMLKVSPEYKPKPVEEVKPQEPQKPKRKPGRPKVSLKNKVIKRYGHGTHTQEEIENKAQELIDKYPNKDEAQIAKMLLEWDTK